MKFRPLWLALLLLSLRPSSAADYLGAEAALAKAEASASSKGRADDGPVDSPRKIFTDFEAFQAATDLAPKAAATQWLTLVQRSFGSGSRTASIPTEFRLDFRKFVVALPPPPAWSPLSEAISLQETSDKASEGRKAALQWFAHRLLGNIPALQVDYEKLVSLNDSVPPQYAAVGLSNLSQMQAVIFQVSDDGAAILKMLERNLDLANPKPSSPRNNSQSFEIPDLVTLVGPEKASAFLKRAFATLPRPLSIRNSYDTRKLAAKLAMENISTLKSPQWELTESMDGGPLYAALAAKFGSQDNESSFRQARGYELLRLLVAGQTTQAVDLSRLITASQPTALPYGAIEKIENSGRSKNVSEFLHDLLFQNPNLPYWSDYIRVSVRAGLSTPMMTLLRATLDRRDLNPSAQGKVEKQYADALLATGQVDQGIAELIKAASLPIQSGQAEEYPRATPFAAAERIARIGLLYQRTEWIDQGISLAREAMKSEKDESGVRQNSLSLAKLLLDLDRGVEAEAVLINALAAAIAPRADNRSSYSDDRALDILCALVGVYAAADRSADVLALLRQAPMWGAGDLSQILSKSCYLGQRRTSSVGACAALALIHTNQPDLAKPIVTALLYDDAGNDRVYALLLELDKSGALALLDQVFATDPFQERPLIWKAKLLLDAGQLDEAEKVARQATKIDPSDGEEGPGDRMRVYAILADILEAKGNAADAKVFRGVVQAIRLSEEADTYFAVGLISQAVAMYEKSLGYFADAYCIQSRLALRKLDLGDWAGAEEHYRRAYELMPDSFGRVESHCFGCERAFAGERQQSLAERVFTKMAAERPTNPQVHYLLGYLRYEQNRYAEALPEFERAVKLDPDYLNAWKKIAAVGAQVHLPAALRNSCALNIIRLDPRRQHSSFELAGVTDLAAVWKALDQQFRDLPPAVKDLFSLKASAEALAAEPARNSSYQSNSFSNRYGTGRSERVPGAIFAAQPFTNAAGNFIQSGDYLNK